MRDHFVGIGEGALHQGLPPIGHHRDEPRPDEARQQTHDCAWLGQSDPVAAQLPGGGQPAQTADPTQPRSAANVSSTTVSHGVGANPKSSCDRVESTMNGAVNW